MSDLGNNGALNYHTGVTVSLHVSHTCEEPEITRSGKHTTEIRKPTTARHGPRDVTVRLTSWRSEI